MASSNTVKVGVACPIPGERAAFLEWLTHAGYEPVPMITLETIARDLTTRPIEALIADSGALAHVARSGRRKASPASLDARGAGRSLASA